MVILGVVLLILWLILHTPLLLWLALALIIFGAVLWFAGPVGTSGTRRRYY